MRVGGVFGIFVVYRFSLVRVVRSIDLMFVMRESVRGVDLPAPVFTKDG